MLRKLYRKLRDKLVLNAVRAIVREETMHIFETQERNKIALTEEIVRLHSRLDAIHSKTFQLGEILANIEHSLKEQTAKSEEAKNIISDGLGRNHARLDDIYYNQQVLAQIPTVHKYFSQFKRIHEGKDVVVIGCGPSLKNYSPIQDAINIGVNGAFRSFEQLDYLFLTDYVLFDPTLNKEIDEFNNETCKKFYCILPQRRLRVLNQFTHSTERIPQSNLIKANAYPVLLEDIWHGKLAVDLETEAFGDWGGSVFSALQFALYTHPKRIFLVGQDCSKGYSYENDIDKDKIPDHSAKIEWFKSFKDFADKMYPDTEIISVNPVGLKGIFKDWYQDQGEEPK